jgi:hypothetical protein
MREERKKGSKATPLPNEEEENESYYFFFPLLFPTSSLSPRPSLSPRCFTPSLLDAVPVALGMIPLLSFPPFAELICFLYGPFSWRSIASWNLSNSSERTNAKFEFSVCLHFFLTLHSIQPVQLLCFDLVGPSSCLTSHISGRHALYLFLIIGTKVPLVLLLFLRFFFPHSFLRLAFASGVIMAISLPPLRLLSSVSSSSSASLPLPRRSPLAYGFRFALADFVFQLIDSVQVDRRLRDARTFAPSKPFSLPPPPPYPPPSPFESPSSASSSSN